MHLEEISFFLYESFQGDPPANVLRSYDELSETSPVDEFSHLLRLSRVLKDQGAHAIPRHLIIGEPYLRLIRGEGVQEATKRYVYYRELKMSEKKLAVLSSDELFEVLDEKLARAEGITYGELYIFISKYLGISINQIYFYNDLRKSNEPALESSDLVQFTRDIYSLLEYIPPPLDESDAPLLQCIQNQPPIPQFPHSLRHIQNPVDDVIDFHSARKRFAPPPVIRPAPAPDHLTPIVKDLITKIARMINTIKRWEHNSFVEYFIRLSAAASASPLYVALVHVDDLLRRFEQLIEKHQKGLKKYSNPFRGLKFNLSIDPSTIKAITQESEEVFLERLTQRWELIVAILNENDHFQNAPVWEIEFRQHRETELPNQEEATIFELEEEKKAVAAIRQRRKKIDRLLVRATNQLGEPGFDWFADMQEERDKLEEAVVLLRKIEELNPRGLQREELDDLYVEVERVRKEIRRNEKRQLRRRRQISVIRGSKALSQNRAAQHTGRSHAANELQTGPIEAPTFEEIPRKLTSVDGLKNLSVSDFSSHALESMSQNSIILGGSIVVNDIDQGIINHGNTALKLWENKKRPEMRGKKHMRRIRLSSVSNSSASNSSGVGTAPKRDCFAINNRTLQQALNLARRIGLGRLSSHLNSMSSQTIQNYLSASPTRVRRALNQLARLTPGIRISSGLPHLSSAKKLLILAAAQKHVRLRPRQWGRLLGKQFHLIQKRSGVNTSIMSAGVMAGMNSGVMTARAMPLLHVMR